MAERLEAPYAQPAMTRMDALLKKLRDQPKTVDAHWQGQLVRWKADLDDLCSRVETWLKPATRENLLKVTRAEFALQEEDTGPYEAPGLEIRVVHSGRKVVLEPKAMRVLSVVPAAGKRLVGAQGRVDLALAGQRVTLLRKLKKGEASWFIVPLAGEMVELEEETFLAALDELMS